MEPRKYERIPNMLIAIIALSVLIGAVYVFGVPAGLPYDEPPHFSTVQYYANNLRLPVLGAPGTNYEAYQAPLYYALIAPLDRLVQPLGIRTEFYLLRLVGLLLLVPLGLFAYRLASRVFGNDSTPALLATAFICLNPALLGVASSIQNDMLSMVLAFWILDAVGHYVQDSALTPLSAVRLGALISAAMLTKMSVIFFPIPIAWFVWIRHGRGGIRFLAIMFGMIALCTGWWFARNKLLYGDLMAVKVMLKLVGQHAPQPHLWSLSEVVRYLRDFLAYIWLPADYFRALIHSSLWERLIVMVSTVVAAFGWCIGRRDRENRTLDRQYEFRKFVFCAYAVSFAIYFYTYVTANPYPPRVLYPMFLVYAVFYSYGLSNVIRRYTALKARGAVAVLSSLMILLCLSMVYKGHSYRTIDFMPEVTHFRR